MSDFFTIQKNSKRNLVLHNVCEYTNFKKIVKPYDLLFFDDCTYDQYNFIIENLDFFKRNKLNCVVAFSTNLYRMDDTFPLKNVRTDVLHKSIVQSTDYLKGFISISELKELLTFDNIFLALHGHNHCNLYRTKQLESMMIFNDELEKSLTSLKELGLNTDIFVYPYDYIVNGSEKILKSKGFRFIYPSKTNFRIYIEDFLNINNETT